MKDENDKNKNVLKREAETMGVPLLGVARLAPLKLELLDLPEDTPERFPFVISLGVPLSGTVMEGIIDCPTRLYFHHYRQANNLLDQTAFKLTAAVEAMGFLALPVAASQLIDWQNQKGHLSHKRVAQGAGMGWLGKNNLIVTPEFGARVRLVSILTDIPLAPDTPLAEGCGDCRTCLSLCPAGAIREEQEDFDHRRCYEQLRIFKEKGNLGHFICGICVKACRGKRG